MSCLLRIASLYLSSFHIITSHSLGGTCLETRDKTFCLDHALHSVMSRDSRRNVLPWRCMMPSRKTFYRDLIHPVTSRSSCLIHPKTWDENILSDRWRHPDEKRCRMKPKILVSLRGDALADSSRRLVGRHVEMFSHEKFEIRKNMK